MPIPTRWILFRAIVGRCHHPRIALRCALQTNRRVVKFTGIGNDPNRTRYYASLEHFRQDIPTLFPGTQHDCLVAQNFMHDEFMSERKPKVYFSREPWEYLSHETRRHVTRADVAPFIISFAEANIDRRMFYVTLPDRASNYSRRLARSLTRRRAKLCCIVNRYATSDRPSLLPERLRFVRAMGADIDIYGRAPHHGENKWNDYPTYKGAARDKIGTLARYNFNLCFENYDEDGYITEKIFQALRAGCVPLYWGGGKYLEQTIPSSCFINCRGQDPVDIHLRIRAMSHEEIVAYRRAGLAFLTSPHADRFTWKYWARLVIDRLENQF